MAAYRNAGDGRAIPCAVKTDVLTAQEEASYFGWANLARSTTFYGAAMNEPSSAFDGDSRYLVIKKVPAVEMRRRENCHASRYLPRRS